MTRSLTRVSYSSLLAVCLLAACSGKEGRIESGLTKGGEYVRVADWDKAGLEVRNVLQIDPKNAQAYFISGQIGEGKREIQRAFNGYSKAVELKPDFLEAKVAMARIYLLAGDVTNAAKHTEEVLAAEPMNPGGRTLKAALLAARGDTTGALKLAQEVLGAGNVVSEEASMLLAGLYTNSAKHVQALEVIDKALKSTRNDLPLLQIAAQIASSANAPPNVASQAEEFYKRSVELAPKNTDQWNSWAAFHLQRNEAQQAEAVLRQAVKSQPEDSARKLTLVSYLVSRRGPEVAIRQYREYIADKPKDAKLRFGLADLYRSINRPDDALATLQGIVELGADAPAGVAARSQIATARLNAGQVGEARILAMEVLKQNPRDSAALIVRGRIALLEGRSGDAVIDLRAALRDQPGAPDVVGLLAQAHRAADEPLLAREVLAEAVTVKPDSVELKLLLAADMTDAKDFKSAGAVIDTALKQSPNNLRVHDVKAMLAVAQKDFNGAERVYRDLKVKAPASPLPYLRLGQLHVQQQRADLALKEYDAAAAVAPTAPEPLLAAVGLLIAQRKFDDAQTRIDKRLQAEPRNILPQQLLGDLWMARADPVKALQHYEKMISLDPKLAQGYQSAARALVAQNKVDAAILLLEQGEKQAPDEVSLPVSRAEWLTRAARHDEAIRLYESLHVRRPGDQGLINNLAYLLTEVKGDRDSLERALKLASGFGESTNPSYLDSLGWIHYKLGDYARAVPLLERAAALAPDSPLLQLHLGLALNKSGNEARSRQVLRRVIETKLALPGLEEARRIVGPG